MGIAAVYGLSTAAFSIGSRQTIIRRDSGECVDCGKRFDEGWLLDCSHVDHDHSKDCYDNPNNGRVQCLDDHLKYHQELGDRNGVYLIQKRIRETRGGHTRKWIEENT